MIASRTRGALTRALIRLAALLALSGPAMAQAPAESAWKSVGAAWVEICTTPCRVTNVSSFAARLAVGSIAPVSDDSAAIVLTSGDAVRDFAVAGLKVYGRALANATRVVIEPLGGPPGGSGGTSTVIGSLEQDVRNASTLNAATANAAITIPINGQSTVAFTFSGLTASGATLSYEQSNDGGTTWTGVSEVNTGTSATSLTRTTDGQVRVAVQGRTNLRIRVSTVGTGTITVAWNVSVREGLISLASPAQMAGLDNGVPRVVLVTTTGAWEPPTCAAGSGKCPPWFSQVPANTSTPILPANPARIGVSIQCTGTAPIAVSEIGATLTTTTPAANSNISLVIPTGSTPYFGPQIASRSAITAYTGTAQGCWGTEYLR